MLKKGYGGHCYVATGVLYHPTGVLYHPTGVLYHPTGVLYHPTGVLYHPTEVLYHPTGVLYHPTEVLYHLLDGFPVRARDHEGWWLENSKGDILDPTRGVFDTLSQQEGSCRDGEGALLWCLFVRRFSMFEDEGWGDLRTALHEKKGDAAGRAYAHVLLSEPSARAYIERYLKELPPGEGFAFFKECKRTLGELLDQDAAMHVPIGSIWHFDVLYPEAIYETKWLLVLETYPEGTVKLGKLTMDDFREPFRRGRIAPRHIFTDSEEALSSSSEPYVMGLSLQDRLMTRKFAVSFLESYTMVVPHYDQLPLRYNGLVLLKEYALKQLEAYYS